MLVPDGVKKEPGTGHWLPCLRQAAGAIAPRFSDEADEECDRPMLWTAPSKSGLTKVELRRGGPRTGVLRIRSSLLAHAPHSLASALIGEPGVMPDPVVTDAVPVASDGAFVVSDGVLGDGIMSL